MFQGGFVPNADRGDLSLLHLRLAADADDVTIADGGSHAAAVAGQGKIRVPRGGDPDIALDVLLRRDGRAAGNGAHQRHPRHFRQGLKPRRRGGGGLNAQQPGRSGVQRGGQLFQLGLGQVVDPFFQFGDGGFGAVSHPVSQLLL